MISAISQQSDDQSEHSFWKKNFSEAAVSTTHLITTMHYSINNNSMNSPSLYTIIRWSSHSFFWVSQLNEGKSGAVQSVVEQIPNMQLCFILDAVIQRFESQTPNSLALQAVQKYFLTSSFSMDKSIFAIKTTQYFTIATFIWHGQFLHWCHSLVFAYEVITLSSFNCVLFAFLF